MLKSNWSWLPLLALLALAPPATAAGLQSYDAVRAGLLAVWAEMPLTARNVTLTAAPATGYGAYTPRASKDFTAGEGINIYLELLGYGFARGDDGTQAVHIAVDLELLDAQGNVLASRQGVAGIDLVSRNVPLETYMSLTGTLGAFAPGEYTMRYRLRDQVSGKQTEAVIPITLVAAPADASSSAPAN